MIKQEKQTKTHRHRQQYGCYRGKRAVGGQLSVKGGKYTVMEGNLTPGGGHTMQHGDHVSQNGALGTYIILLTNATPINLIKRKCK